MTDAATVVLREMRWWDLEPVLALEHALFPEDAWSAGMFWSELAHARGPQATRRYVVAEAEGKIVGYAASRRPGSVTYRPSLSPASSGAPDSGPGS